MLKCRLRTVLTIFLLTFVIATPLAAARFYILEDYYNILGSPYSKDYLPFVTEHHRDSLYLPSLVDEPFMPRLFSNGELQDDSYVKVDLAGQLELNMFYGRDFALGKSGTTGAGTAGLSDGFGYDFLSRILLTGSVADRLFVEFDYDSERKEEELGGDRNTYTVSYRGREDEFLKEASVGNKELAIRDSRYIDIDEGNADSFALKADAGWDKFHMEGLFRFNDALEGRKEFSGSRNSIEFTSLDMEYVRRQFFFIPDTAIDEGTLALYKTATGSVDETVDGKYFALLRRGRDYTFDNARGRIYLLNALSSSEELIVYYKKGVVSVGDGTLGINAIIDAAGARDNFNITDYPEYFDGDAISPSYLYLQKNNFNSYWELKNAYFLDEYEGETLFNVSIELRATANKGLNSNYDALLNRYEIDTNVGVIFFNFEDSVGFYPRPFPGTDPYPTDNPFGPLNPIYGGVGDPLPEDSVSTLHISYSYNTDIYFLDFNLVPGSVNVWLNGVLLDAKYYTVDHEFGMLTFDEGLIKSSDKIVTTYRYTGFGFGEQGLFTALGFYYENGPFYAQNLTAYETGLKGREAPDVGSEETAVLTNATSVKVNLGATDEDEEGLYGIFDGEFAFAQTNNNVYGSAIIADMERDDFTIDLSMNDQGWMLATKSSLLPVALTKRGDVLFKNYWEDKVIGSDELRTLSWSVPADQVFDYSEKAGPYNTADKPTGGADISLVMEYDFTAGSSEPYASVVIPLNNANYSSYERFNMALEGVGISGDSVQVYVELLQEYDEDLNGSGPPEIDGEESINDAGFSITPEDGNPTVIGTNREGGSNGRIDSEDLNGNRILDTSESGVLIRGDTTDYVEQLSTGNSGWQFVSVNILPLIESEPGAFQSATALRITLTSVTSPLAQDAAGRLVINRIWFSGSSLVNESKEYLNMSEVSVDEDDEVKNNALSESYPGLYDELHGDSSYRNRNDLVEKVLKVIFDPSDVTPQPQLNQGEEATMARRFAIPIDVSFYGDYSMFLYLPASQTVPANMDFTLSLVSSQNEELRTVIQGSQVVQGWNRIDVHLRSPYRVVLNGVDVGNMTKSGDLRILNRLAEIQFGFFANSGVVTQSLEIWLDEWFVHNSEGYFDTAIFTEGHFGYRGDAVSVGDFPLVGDPSLLLGFERREGHFYESSDERNDRVYTGLDVDLLRVLGTEVYLSRESTTNIRNEEGLPGGLSTDDYRTQQSHALELSFDNPYIPSLRHSYDRIVTNSKDIDLKPTGYQYNDDTLYDESLFFSEWFNFPFGLSQAYTFNRFWLYSDSLQQDASVDQQDRLDLSYSWNSGSTSTYLMRDRLYTGSSVPEVDTWGGAYINRLGTLFKPVSETIVNSTRYSTTDGYGLNVNIPLMNVVGFSLFFDTDYSQKNFSFDETERDAVYNHDFEMAFPFYFPGIDQIEVTPLMRREFRGDYKAASNSITRGEMYLESLNYLFLRPPFYYMYPGGRKNDYKAVDIFREEIGTSTNSLYNSYTLDVVFGYDRWFIPGWLSLGINGETRREGESYQQSRGWTTSIQYNVPLSHAEEYFKNNLVMTFDYEGERQFDTKLLDNSFSLTTEYNSLRTEFQGLKIYDQIGYTRQRQHVGEENYYLKPGVPDTGTPVALVPPSDTISNEFQVSYLWEVFPKMDFLIVKPDSEYKSSIKNEEIFSIENNYTITDRNQAQSFSNLPLRLTLEHETEYDITDSLFFTAYSIFMFGIEEQVQPDYPRGNVLTSFGFEFGAKLEIYF